MELIPLYTTQDSKSLDKYSINSSTMSSEQFMGFAALSIFATYKDIFHNFQNIIILSGSTFR